PETASRPRRVHPHSPEAVVVVSPAATRPVSSFTEHSGHDARPQPSWSTLAQPGVPGPHRGFSSEDVHRESASHALMRTAAKTNSPAPPGVICRCAPFTMIDCQEYSPCLPPGGGHSHYRCLCSQERAGDITTEIPMSAIGNTSPTA